jgi:hypothetical protein
LMRPFPRWELDFAKTVFNGKLSSKRRTTERAFGLLTKMLGIFQKAFETNVEVTRVCNQKCMCCLKLCKKNTTKLKLN